MTTQTTAGKQRRGRPFPRGVSGNRAGRPKGARNRASIMAEAVSDADAVAIARAVVSKAKRGDMAAARLVFDRLWPAPKGRVVEFALPSATDIGGIVSAHSSVLEALAAGEITPDEAQNISGLLTAHLRAIEIADFDRRLSSLETKVCANEHAAPSP